MVAESPSCLVATMAPCQQFRSGLSSPDARYQQQNPAAVLYQRSKSLSPSLLGYQQPTLMAAPLSLGDPHRSVLVHTGAQGQGSGLLHSSTPAQQASPVIHYSPTHQQLRCGSQEFQHIMYCENFGPGAARPGPPPSVAPGQRLSPGSYPTVIQQQNAGSPRAAKNGPPVSDQKEVLPSGVTIKQEQNLDQTYLDDGELMSFLLALGEVAPKLPLPQYMPIQPWVLIVVARVLDTCTPPPPAFSYLTEKPTMILARGVSTRWLGSAEPWPPFLFAKFRARRGNGGTGQEPLSWAHSPFYVGPKGGIENVRGAHEWVLCLVCTGEHRAH